MTRRDAIVASLALGFFAFLLVLPVAAQESPGSAQRLPPGHPPTGGSMPPGRVPAPPPGSGLGASGLTWTVPAGWIEEPPASALRRAQYRISGPGGDAECVVYYFGPGQGGDPEANAERWAGQFSPPGGGSSKAPLATRRLDIGGVRVLMVETAGTYSGGMGGLMRGPARPDYMLLGAIAEGPDANWFFKATGPRATLEPQRSAFEGMINSIKRGG